MLIPALLIPLALNAVKRSSMNAWIRACLCHNQSWWASPPWVVVLFCFSIDAPKTRRLVTATGVVAQLPEFQPAADGRWNTRGVMAGEGEAEVCVVSWKTVRVVRDEHSEIDESRSMLRVCTGEGLDDIAKDHSELLFCKSLFYLLCV